MKKLSLLLAVGMTAVLSNAQQNNNRMIFENQEIKKPLKINESIVENPIAIKNNFSHNTNKTTATSSRWYNAVDNFAEDQSVTDINDANHSNLFDLWQDSSIYYSAATHRGINTLSIAQAFDPTATFFNDNNLTINAGKMAILKTNSYNLDSVKILGYYSRINHSYVDTMILTIATETSALKFSYFKYNAKTWGIDSFPAMFWSIPNYQVKPINLVGYTSGTTHGATIVNQIKIPLNDATFIDTLTNGTYVGFHEIKAAINQPMPANTKAAISFTFKSGTNYTAHDTIGHYNHFLFLSHSVSDASTATYPDLSNGGSNMSYVCGRDTTYTNFTSTLALYDPTIGFIIDANSKYYSQVHNISWKATCTSCNTVSVSNLSNIASEIKAVPNPANSNLTVSLKMNEAATVNVNITNTLGQIVATQSLGKIAKGENATANFNTTDLSNGIYFYTIEANGARQTNRILIAH